MNEYREHLVSVIMPSYNTGRFISESIESVIGQTYRNWELIIVDDCSTDETREVVEKYISDKRIIFVENLVNSGAAVSRNRALKMARGRYIAFLDSDDIWLPDKLARQVRFMAANDYCFSYTCYEEIDENDKRLGRVVSGPVRISRRKMYQYCWPGCLTVMFDRSGIGPEEAVIKDIRKNNDYAMWLRISRKADCYLLDDVLAGYRKRKGSISNHGYLELVKWHYKMFCNAEGMNVPLSVYHTVQNVVFGIYKKLFYIRQVEGNHTGVKRWISESKICVSKFWRWCRLVKTFIMRFKEILLGS